MGAHALYNHTLKCNTNLAYAVSLEVPQSAKCMHSSFAAALHHLVIALHVGGNEDDLSPKSRPRILKEFHRVWSSAALLRVPENHSFGFDVFVDQTCDGRAEGLLLIGAYPDEKPVWALDASRQRCPNAGSGADADSSLEHRGGVADASYNPNISDGS